MYTHPTPAAVAGPALNHDTAGAGLWLAESVELHEEPARGRRTHSILVNRRGAVALTLTPDEAALCRSLSAGEDVTPGPVLDALADQGFLARPGTHRPPRKSERRPPFSGVRQFMATLDAHSTRANGLVVAIHRRVGWFAFSPAGLVGQSVLALAGLVAFVHALTSPVHLQFRAHPGQIPLALALSLVAIGVHEMAHALVLVHHGRRVDAIGFRLHLGTPAFYVEAIDALLLTRRQRIVQAFAGSWAEWQFTSLVALWVWVAPTPAGLVLLYRFLILNGITIATNLLPFVGLDGHLMLADLIGEPDLIEQTRGAAGRLVIALIGGRRTTTRQWALAGYASVNGAVATVLLASAGLFWYATFGGLLAWAADSGVLGWTVLLAIGCLLARPGLTGAWPKVAPAAGTLAEIASRLRFRWQTSWRVTATEALVHAVPRLAALTEQELGVLAGQAIRDRRGLVRFPGLPAVRVGAPGGAQVLS